MMWCASAAGEAVDAGAGFGTGVGSDGRTRPSGEGSRASLEAGWTMLFLLGHRSL
jgi:hypothetical protein